MARRSGKKRKLKKTLFIVCEGKNTEPIYFAGLIEDVRRQTQDYTYEVIIYDTPKNDPLGLVNEAKTLLEDSKNDEAWTVFDKDGYTKHEKAFELARKEAPKINIAFSSISFEHWILLHYERNFESFTKSKEIITHLRENNLFTNYSKRQKLNLYAKLRKRTFRAIENAAWLRFKQSKEIAKHSKKIYEINPYTNVDKLVRKLILYNTFIRFGKLKEKFFFHSFVFQINKFDIFEEEIQIRFFWRNKSKKILDWRNKIVLGKENEKIYPRTLDTLILYPNEKSVFTLKFEKKNLRKEIRIGLLAEKLLLILEL